MPKKFADRFKMNRTEYIEVIKQRKDGALVERVADAFPDNSTFSAAEADTYLHMLERSTIEKELSGLKESTEYTARLPKISRFRKREESRAEEAESPVRS